MGVLPPNRASTAASRLSLPNRASPRTGAVPTSRTRTTNWAGPRTGSITVAGGTEDGVVLGEVVLVVGEGEGGGQAVGAQAQAEFDERLEEAASAGPTKRGAQMRADRRAMPFSRASVAAVTGREVLRNEGARA